MWEGKRPIYATLISSGQAGLEDPKKTTATVRGVFRIRNKHITATMDSNESSSVGGRANTTAVAAAPVEEAGDDDKPKAVKEAPRPKPKSAAKDVKGAKGGARAPAVDAAEILAGLSVKLTPITSPEEISEFLEQLARRTYGKAPFANATDLVYLWVAWREGATLITLDRGLLKYHRILCDVIRPSPVRFT